MEKTEWLKVRKNFIGASEAGAILGFNPFKTAYDVWVEKTSDDLPKELTGDAIEFGLKLEPIIAETFEERTKRKVLRDNKIRISERIPFLSCSLDRMILPLNGEGRGVLEIKTVSSSARQYWEDKIPLNYFAQIQQQLFVTGLQYGFFAILVDGRYFETIEIKKDDDYIHQQNEKLTKFWNDHILTKIPPEKVVKDLETIESNNDAFVEATEELVSTHAKLIEIKKVMKQYEEQEEKLSDILKLAMGEKGLLKFQGITLATWKKSADGVKIDEKKFKEANPEMYKAYSIPKPGVRRFLVKGGE